MSEGARNVRVTAIFKSTEESEEAFKKKKKPNPQNQKLIKSKHKNVPRNPDPTESEQNTGV